MHILRIGCLTAFLLTGSACASELGNKASGQACTRSVQCAEQLRCLGGSCQRMEAGEHEDNALDAGKDSDAELETGAGPVRSGA
jgi:hypothetical protein